MLSLLTATAMSAAEVGRELGITHANASYHLRLLADAELIVVEGEEQIRGGPAKRYRHPIDRSASPPSPKELAAQVESMRQSSYAGSTTVTPTRPRCSPTPSSGSAPRCGARRPSS